MGLRVCAMAISVAVLLALAIALLSEANQTIGQGTSTLHRQEIRADGAIRLTTPPGSSSDQNPAFSPDGTRMVFTRFENGYNVGPAGLFLLDLSSGHITRLTAWEDQDNVNLPGSVWNAALNRIIFASDRAEADDLWRIAPDGTDFSRITAHVGLHRYIEPSWSPDGQWVVFEASRPGLSEDGRVGEIWKVRGDGTGLTPLTGTSGLDDRQPNWSPVGDRILFQRRSLPGGQWDIYTMAADGSNVQNVTADTAADDTDASWSPDGRDILYSSDHGGLTMPNIFVIPATGGQPTRVTQASTAADGAPSWSPDGRWVAFESHTGDESPAALWRIWVPQCYDLTGDDLVVTAADIQAIAQLWHQGYNENWDFYRNGHIDVVDIMLVAAHWGQRCQDVGLETVNDFLYQLQNLDLTAIGDTAYDLVVMDYSSDGTAAGEFTAAQVNALKHSPGGEKIVLAYMSIGEAESYRYYWNPAWDDQWLPGVPDADAPAWLDLVNPDWPGNYKVRYWHLGWQAVILDYTDRLLDAGFDGAYLDIIDAYEYYADRGRSTAAQEMANFVAAIRAHAHTRDSDFYIFPQNAPELATLVPAYLNSVDGIGQEDIYYGYNADDVMTPPAVTAALEGYLDVFKNAGRLVLTIDYATTPAHVDNAYARSLAKGYVPFVTVRDLDQLTINPGHEPD